MSHLIVRQMYELLTPHHVIRLKDSGRGIGGVSKNLLNSIKGSCGGIMAGRLPEEWFASQIFLSIQSSVVSSAMDL